MPHASRRLHHWADDKGQGHRPDIVAIRVGRSDFAQGCTWVRAGWHHAAHNLRQTPHTVNWIAPFPVARVLAATWAPNPFAHLSGQPAAAKPLGHSSGLASLAASRYITQRHRGPVTAAVPPSGAPPFDVHMQMLSPGRPAGEVSDVPPGPARPVRPSAGPSRSARVEVSPQACRHGDAASAASPPPGQRYVAKFFASAGSHGTREMEPSVSGRPRALSGEFI